MIRLENDTLFFSFPNIHPQAQLAVDFPRTLRIPDDAKSYPLPPGLGDFPLRHIDDFPSKIPGSWAEHGGVMLPMYQSEALWLNFTGGFIEGHGTDYPFAIRVATGKIDAVTGKRWRLGLAKPRQNYMVSTKQPWLDGYCVEKGFIRQFVAMPLGAGYTAEEQVTGKAEHGGLQISVHPMKRSAFERHFPRRPKAVRRDGGYEVCDAMAAPSEMGLAPGGRMRQEIYEDPFQPDDWDQDTSSKCFVHIANSLVWREITGERPPTVPATAKEYADAGLPWFQYYSDTEALEGSKTLGGMKSVAQLGKEKGDVPLPENQSCVPDKVVALRAGLAKNEVRDGRF